MATPELHGCQVVPVVAVVDIRQQELPRAMTGLVVFRSEILGDAAPVGPLMMWQRSRRRLP
jgi:hypothetical protein